MYFCVVRESLSMVDVVFCAASLLSADVVDDDFFLFEKTVLYSIQCIHIYLYVHAYSKHAQRVLSVSFYVNDVRSIGNNVCTQFSV